MIEIQARRFKRCIFQELTIILLGLAAVSPVSSAGTGSPVVRAVLFASPTCPHCAKVREEVLPPLAARYGSQLQVAIVSTATPVGYELFFSACMQHGLLNQSVPLLIVGNTALIGSDDIPLRFPELVEKYLAEGGIDWPNIPGLSTMLASSPALSPEVRTPAESPAPAIASSMVQTPVAGDAPPAAVSSAPSAAQMKKIPPTMTASSGLPRSPALSSPKAEHPAPDLARGSSEKHSTSLPAEKSASAVTLSSPVTAARTQTSGIIDLTGGEEAGILERIRRDLYGNGLAILILAGMILAFLVSPTVLRRAGASQKAERSSSRDWVTPILAAAGIGVAAYLSHVELQKVEAICGPVGDCNTVQHSEYARLFGVLPIGVLGLAGFIAILTVWILRRCGSGRIPLWAAVGILGMTGFGTLFSIYLTFLEPFIIGATCLWCLSSALIMTTLYVLALKPGRQAWSDLSRNRS